MRIMDFLVKEAVTVDLAATTKKDALRELAEMLRREKKISEVDDVVGVLMERERKGTTGIGQGVAIPHGKTDQVDNITAAFGVSRKGVDFEALDGEPVHILFLLLLPASAASAGEHLKALARISRLLKDKFFRQALREAKSAEEIPKIIAEEDTA